MKELHLCLAAAAQQAHSCRGAAAHAATCTPGCREIWAGRIWVTKDNSWATRPHQFCCLCSGFQTRSSSPVPLSLVQIIQWQNSSQSPASVDQILRHCIRQRKFIMVRFSNESYEQTFKKGILELNPAGLKGSRISASVPRPSAVSTQSASRVLTFKSMPLQTNISPKYCCQHSSKRRQKLCVTQRSRFKPELSITDTNNWKNQVCSWNKLYPQWTKRLRHSSLPPNSIQECSVAGTASWRQPTAFYLSSKNLKAWKRSVQCILSRTISSITINSALVIKSPGVFLNLGLVLA